MVRSEGEATARFPDSLIEPDETATPESMLQHVIDEQDAWLTRFTPPLKPEKALTNGERGGTERTAAATAASAALAACRSLSERTPRKPPIVSPAA